MNQLVTIEVRGSMLRAVLAASIAVLNAAEALEDPAGRFLHLSGARITWFIDDDEVTLGSVEIESVNNDSATTFRALNDQTVYTITTSQFLADGGDGYEAFALLEQEEVGATVHTAVIRYIEQNLMTTAYSGCVLHLTFSPFLAVLHIVAARC